MRTYHRAFGIAAVTFIAALLGFLTPDASGAPNIWLPSILLGIGFAAVVAGVAGRNGSARMQAWVNGNF